MECKFCKKHCKNANSLRNHERLCNNNPQKQKIISNFVEYNNLVKIGKKEKKFKNQYVKAKELGLPKPQITDETRKKISESSKKRKFTEEEKKKHSEIMKRAVEKYPESYTKNNVVGRVKNCEYNGKKLKGSWEVLVAQWLDNNNIIWENETKYFEYEWNGKRRYFPDFYLPNYDLFIEVKGYERERDLAKWKNIPNLVVFKKYEIDLIKKGKMTMFLN